MGSGKQSNSETSSEEIDEAEKVAAMDDTAGTGRSYECNFCKRGFTNAQALGGHMNIHRKDKAKAIKQKIHHYHQETTTFANKSHEDYYNTSNSKYFGAVSNDHQRHYYSSADVRPYQVHFPASNPSFLNGFNHQYYELPSSPRLPNHHEYHMDQSLSLRIGLPNHMEEADNDNDDDDDDDDDDRNEESDIDLELRLGHNP